MFQRKSPRPRRTGRGLLGVAVLLVAAWVPHSGVSTHAAGAAVDQQNPLSLASIGQNGAFYSVTVAAGSSVTLEVLRSNVTRSPVEARTYAAPVFSITNGGFGARDAGTAASGATVWVDYADSTFTLAPESSSVQAFDVTVPAGTTPGEYASSIALENVAPETSADTGAVTLTNVIRHAIEISIRVPGELRPSFAFGEVSHRTSGVNSSVEVAITNTGNEHLRPEGVMYIRDSSGREVSEAPIAMGVLYAHTETTKVAAGLGGELDPGDYTVSMTLTDIETGATASLDGGNFTVAAPVVASAPLTAQLPQILRAPADSMLPVVGLIAAGLLGLAAILALLLAWRRTKRRLEAALAAAPAAEPSAEPSSESAPDEPSPESAAAGPAAARP